MKIGIIFAMKEELSALKKYINIEEEKKIFDLTFYIGRTNGIECVLVESGIGKVNAARTTQILIDKENVDYVFNIGVAGATISTLNVGDIIIGEKLAQHDFDITAFNHEKGYIPNVGTYIYSDEKLVDAAKEIDGTKVGVIASGDLFCTDINVFSKINNKFNALCTEMEGAAVAQVCYLSNIPFLIMRSISDKPNNNNKENFNEFLEKSSDNIANVMLRLIEELNETIC